MSPDSNNNKESTIPVNSNRKKNKPNFIQSLTDMPRLSNLQKTCVEIDFDDEMDKYENFRIIQNDKLMNELNACNPLIFFQYNSSQFPLLSQIAKELLCIPATSVPSESLFSMAGIIQNELRNRINPGLLNILNFYKANMN